MTRTGISTKQMFHNFIRSLQEDQLIKILGRDGDTYFVKHNKRELTVRFAGGQTNPKFHIVGIGEMDSIQMEEFLTSKTGKVA